MDMDPAPLATLRDAIGAGRFPNLHAVLVARRGKLVFEEYAGGMGPDSLQYTASVSKSVGATVFGMTVYPGLASDSHSGGL
ncbi:MAG: serine hydrolase, partial [Akkermansiaceae bacterium]|nr:serine hydrolase [Akkermansiaceae bacterium]